MLCGNNIAGLYSVVTPNLYINNNSYNYLQLVLEITHRCILILYKSLNCLKKYLVTSNDEKMKHQSKFVTIKKLILYFNNCVFLNL